MIWLIAEDETDILNLVATMSQVWGHQALTFENGQKVWDWLDKVESGDFTGGLPDFVLMDIRMPGKKGNEVARRMRKVAGFQNIPLVLMTAFSLSQEERQEIMKQDGVDHIISKPLPGFEDLRRLLHGIIADKLAKTG